ncbi:MAG: alpha/beta fold hydrolase [Saprospiraceae bacterium]|nr:alpha/beta fold hydrolase [Saprospiraceae bacterium]
MFLDVGNGHRINFEEYGNPKGIKVLFLHGGPGLGYTEKDKELFDPHKFHVILIDQRGCGKSKPKGSLAFNTTSDLIQDINRVLEANGISSVIIFGGSWGATLGVLFAAKYPEKVNKLILRGFFPATKECADIYLRGDIKNTHPLEWKRVMSFVPKQYQNKVPEFYFDKISNKEEGFQQLGYEWSRYGFSLSRKRFKKGELDQLLDPNMVDYDRILIELHYAFHFFFIPEQYIFHQALKIKDHPIYMVHGTHDYLCPLMYAKQFFTTIKNGKLEIVDGGHSIAEKEVKAALIRELNRI